MKEFFARLYEWFGFVTLYSHDLAEHLRGQDFACTGYFAIPWYLYVGWIMVIGTIVIYALQFDIISPTRFTQRGHWCLVAFTIVIVNFLIATIIPGIDLQMGTYCARLKLSVIDCIGFGISNALWSFILFVILSGIQPITGAIIKWRKPVFRNP